MLKNLLKKCAETLNRDDIVQTLNKTNDLSEIDDGQIKNDIYRLISYFNFISKTICEDYSLLKETESILSSPTGQIEFFKFHHTPTKIIAVFDLNMNKKNFLLYPESIKTNVFNEMIYVTYNYILPDKQNLTDKLEITKLVPEKIFVYGVLSEFLASKNQFEASEFWKNKFMFELFKIKIKKERRFKSTFCKWKKYQKVIFIQIKFYL